MTHTASNTNAPSSDAPAAGVPSGDGGMPGAAASGLRGRAVRGSAWAFGSYFVSNVLRLVSNLVLAHVLFPEAFALTALAGVVLQALTMFSDLGIAPSIVHSKRGDDPAFLNTAWTVQFLRGVILWLMSCALAWPMARFYEAPELVWVIPACGLTCIIAGLHSTNLHVRTREINLGLVTVLGTCESILKMVLTVIWALIWPSVWAIIGGALISYTMFMIATHTLLPGIRNRFAWDKDAVRSLVKFGGWVFVSTSATFLAMQSDRLILGKLASMEVLGVYSVACMLSRLPQEIIARLASQVQLPVLAEINRNNPSRIEATLLESRRVLLAVAQFGTLGVVVVSPWFFDLLYDPAYAEAAVYAPLSAISVWFAMLFVSCAFVLLAVGDSKTVAISNGANAAVTLAGCILGYSYAGMPGFIAGVGLGNLVGHGVVVWALRRRGVGILAQDVRFSALVGLGSAAVLGVPVITESALTQIGVGAAVLALSGACVARIGWPMIEGKLGLRRRFGGMVAKVADA